MVGRSPRGLLVAGSVNLGVFLLLVFYLRIYASQAALRGEIWPDSTAHYISKLTDKDSSIRIDAVRWLGYHGDYSAVKPLSEALQDDELAVRRAAVFALGSIADTGAVLPLLDVLNSEDRSFRIDVSWALGRIGDPRALEALIRMQEDPDPIIRIQAVRALGGIDDPLRMEPLHKMLEDESSSVRYVTSGVLAKIRDRSSIRPLIKALKYEVVPDPTYVVCGGEPGGVRYALTQIGEPAVEPLIKALRSCRWGIRYHSAVALGIIGDTQAVQPLIRRLRDCNNHVRRVAATALGWLKDTAAVEPLIDLLDEPSISAVWALGEIKDDRAIEPLVPLLYSEHDSVKESALASLKKLGKPATEDLINLVSHDDPEVRLFAVRALEWDTVAVECFISVLNKEDELDEIKEIAAWALVRIGDERAVESMINALLDDNIKVSAAALGFLMKFPVPEAIEPLLDFIEIYPNLTENVLPILGGIGSEGVGPLLSFIKNEDPKIRATVAYVLGKSGDSRAIEPLIETLKDRDPYPRRAAVYALKKLTSQGFGEDYKAWRAWWRKNEESFIK